MQCSALAVGKFIRSGRYFASTDPGPAPAAKPPGRCQSLAFHVLGLLVLIGMLAYLEIMERKMKPTTLQYRVEWGIKKYIMQGLYQDYVPSFPTQNQ